VEKKRPTEARCVALGVDYDEPDDFKFWSELDRKESIVQSFRYHIPTDAQIERISSIRKGHIELAELIMRSTAVGADQTAALRKLHEAMMTANKAIVLETE
jgi:hypothetical protein